MACLRRHDGDDSDWDAGYCGFDTDRAGCGAFWGQDFFDLLCWDLQKWEFDGLGISFRGWAEVREGPDKWSPVSVTTHPDYSPSLPLAGNRLEGPSRRNVVFHSGAPSLPNPGCMFVGGALPTWLTP